MRLLSFVIVICIFATPTLSADMPSRKKVPSHWGICGGLCRHLDQTTIECHSNERPYYNEEGECTGCEQDSACTTLK